MRTLLVCAAIVLSSIGPCWARVVVHQTNGANVFGFVQAGPGPSTIDVRQDGDHNIAGVIQVSPRSTANLRQTGGSNTSAVFQEAPASGRNFWGGMP